MWRATTVRRRLGIPRDCLLIAWTQGDYRGMQVPGEPMVPVRYWPPVLALSAEWLWLSKAGAVRRFALEDVVLVSVATRPRGALRIDFMEGGPLVIRIDDEYFRNRLNLEIQRRDERLQMAAPAALGLPELPAEPLAEAAELRRRAEQLQERAGDNLQVRIEAEDLLDAARETLQQAQVAGFARPAGRAAGLGRRGGGIPDGLSGAGRCARRSSATHERRPGGEAPLPEARVTGGERLWSGTTGPVTMVVAPAPKRAETRRS